MTTSAKAESFFSSGILSIFGEPTDDALAISRNASGNILVNGGTLPIRGEVPTVGNTRSMVVFGVGGDDEIDFDESNGALPSARIFAGAGNDRIVAGSGADQLYGQAGNDTIDGRGGADLVFGGDGNDILNGGDGADRLFGGDGDDTIDGDRGNDVAFLGAGNDLFIWDPGDGSDRVEGEEGFDTLEFNSSGADETIAISANGSRAKVTRDIGNITMDVHGIERIDLQPLGGADKIVVNDMTGAHVQEVRIDLEGIENGGVADGKVDSVILEGTNGADFVSVLSQPGNLFVLGLPSFVTVQHAEAADRFTINGGAGNDRIEAGSIAADAGSFTFDGGTGNDIVFSTNGTDLLLGGEGNDFVDGQRGVDAAFLGAGDDTFVWERGDGNDVVEGGAGFDGVRLSGSSAGEAFTVSAGGERVRVSADVDSLAMDANDVELISLLSFGGADMFVIDDLSGTDVQTIDLSLFDFGVPGGNSDTVVINGTSGDDTITLRSENGVVIVEGLATTIRITGTDAAGDRIEINGLGGNDTIDATGLEAAEMRFFGDGGAGNDTILGGVGDDVISGGSGNDVLFAGAGDNVVFGGGGDDVLRGEQGDDVLDGGAGDDVLIGGGGDNILLNGEVVFDSFAARLDDFVV